MSHELCYLTVGLWSQELVRPSSNKTKVERSWGRVALLVANYDDSRKNLRDQEHISTQFDFLTRFDVDNFFFQLNTCYNERAFGVTMIKHHHKALSNKTLLKMCPV